MFGVCMWYCDGQEMRQHVICLKENGMERLVRLFTAALAVFSLFLFLSLSFSFSPSRSLSLSFLLLRIGLLRLRHKHSAGQSGTFHHQ